MATSLGEISGVGDKTEKKLNDAGVHSIEDLAKSDPSDFDDINISEHRAEKLIRRAKENAIVIQTTEEREEEYNEREEVTTGIDKLDELIGGGFEEEALVAGYGRTSSGKTQLAFKALSSAVEQTGEPAVYIETERDRFRPERVKSLSNDPSVVDDIHVVRAYDLDQQLNAYSKVKRSFSNLSLVVVDSFTARFRMSEEFSDRSTYGSRSEAFRQHLNGLEELAASCSTPIYLSCQIYPNPDMYGGEVIYGSSIFDHMALYYLHLVEEGDLRRIHLENHPARAEDSIMVNIGSDDIVGVEEE